MEVSAAEEEEGANINQLPQGLLHFVFSFLGPRDLCAASCTCVLWRRLNRDRVSNSVWKKFYTSRWSVSTPEQAAGDVICWQSKYGSKMKQGKSWTGKYEHDSLYGHKAGVKSLKLLPSHGMLLTGSLDRTVRLWDLNYGMPLSISRPHGGTVRSVALDAQLVVSGSSDNVVRLWHARNSTHGRSALDPAAAAEASALLQDSLSGAAAATAAGPLGLAEGLQIMEMDGPGDADVDEELAAAIAAANAAAVSSSSSTGMGTRGGIPSTHGPYSVVTGDADDTLFDLSLPGQQLRGHIGPVTSLCLSDSCLYSGSWDYTVRCWRRGSWDCISVLKYQDWVWSVVARGGLLLVASGPEVHVHDLPTGKLVRKFQNLHEGSVSCVEGTHSGKMLFSGGADGLLMAHDLRMKESSRVLWHHNAGVHGLALEDPWLVSAASDGTVVMHNYEAAVPTHSSFTSSSNSSSLPMRRSLSTPGYSGPMYCVDMAESWLAAGGESPAVRTWDFTKAAEAAARAAAAKAARNSSKQAAKQRKAAAAAAQAAGDAAGVGAGRGGKCGGGNSGGSRKGRSSGNGSGQSGGGGQNTATTEVPASCAAGTGTAAPHGLSSAAAAGASFAAAAAFGSVSGSSRPRGLLAAAAAAARAGDGSGQSGAAAGASSGDRYHRMQHNRGGQQQPRQQHCSIGQHSGLHRANHGHSLQQYGSPQQHWHGAHGSSPNQQHWQGRYGSSPQQQQQHQQWHGRYGSSPQQHWMGGSPPSNGRWQPHNSRGHVPAQQQQQCEGCTGVGSSRAAVGNRECSGIPIPNGTSSSSGSAGHRNHGAARNAGRAAESCGSSAAAADADSGGSPAGAGTSYCVPFSSSYPAAGQPSPWLVSGSSPRFEVMLRRGQAAEKQPAPSRAAALVRGESGRDSAGVDAFGSFSN